MKMLRTTWFDPRGYEPLTAVMAIREDLDPETIKAEEFAKTDELGFFAVVVIEDVDGPEVPEELLTQIVATRWLENRALTEGHMAMLYYYDAASLRMVKSDGVVMATKPAPLNKEDISFVLTRLAKHPDYEGQTIVCITEDSEIVSMRNGEIRGVL